jgi:hypothetical protein
MGDVVKDEVGFQPADTFDVLRERTRSLRAKRDHVEWSSISLEIQGVPIQRTRSCGVARIDKSLFRNLAAGEPTLFRVEPGEHTITVLLSRWVKLPGYRDSARLSIQVDAVAGEQVKVVCGLRPAALEEWRAIRIARFRSVLMFGVGSLLVVVYGWFLFAFLGSLLAPAAILIMIRGVTIPPIALGLGLRAVVIAPLFLGWCWLAKRLILVPDLRVLQSLVYRFRYPYFLKKAEDPLSGRQPAL